MGSAIYRLVMVAVDGKSFSSETVEVTRDQISFELHQVYPIPFSESLNVYFSSPTASFMDLVLVDMQGRPVLSQRIETRAGSQEIKLETEGLPNGMYVLRMRQEGSLITRKIVK